MAHFGFYVAAWDIEVNRDQFHSPSGGVSANRLVMTENTEFKQVAPLANMRARCLQGRVVFHMVSKVINDKRHLS